MRLVAPPSSSVLVVILEQRIPPGEGADHLGRDCLDAVSRKTQDWFPPVTLSLLLADGHTCLPDTVKLEAQERRAWGAGVQEQHCRAGGPGVHDDDDREQPCPLPEPL